MSDLATIRVRIADTITGKNDHWEVRWMLHGEAVLGVNLAQARYVSVDEEHRKVTLSLPECHVISSKVDHHRSEELSAKRLSWIPSPGLQSLRDDVWRSADEKVYRLAQHEDYLDATRLQTERALCQLFQGVGWSIEYEWRSKDAEPPHAEALVETSR